MVAKSDGTEPRMVTAAHASMAYGNYPVVHWSPDGSHITAVARNEKNSQGLVDGLVQIDQPLVARRPWLGLAGGICMTLHG